MREIKFRAWDIGNKRMLIPAMPLLGGGLSWGEKGGYDAGGRDYILEQFTGIKDKNGKEIYEGDILQYENTKSKSFRRTVKFDFGGFGYRDLGKSWVFLSVRCGEFEIIGNVNENPELLEVQP